MSNPFPGMNPYLESPEFWSGIHGRIIVFLADVLSPQLRPKYFVAVEERIYETTPDDRVLVGIPDVVVRSSQTATSSQTENIAIATSSTQPSSVTLPIPQTVKERYLEVRKVETKEVVAVIEVLSPKNKRTGEGRNAYETKRNRILTISTHLIEIDLLRAGEAMPMLNHDIQSDYRILVSRSNKRPKADLYAFNLKDNIPTFPLPLREEDKEPLVDLQELINGIYERASYDLVIDYSQEPVPALREEDNIWVDELLKEQKLR
ncbi:hypothetical protein Riv7116_3947 [Rivularia sp. PCC 7116]|uniref:DUF4058 family protein n=1 Tax=Rivularia sp. PCC 7116 TaxID=373994 RepID=UPI00029F3EF1|nr:DUF4058 family protein [Rivularia sp. PCC 7116]AFY56387.1 hypothetical protein Riv7116_3947 [Rivularia sp. PCC 7116]